MRRVKDKEITKKDREELERFDEFLRLLHLYQNAMIAYYEVYGGPLDDDWLSL